jgi:transposase-like protein
MADALPITKAGLPRQKASALVDIQPASGYAPHVAAPGDSITELAQQHGVSRESLLEFVRSKIQQARDDNGEPPLDHETLDRALTQTLDDARGAGYTSNARTVPQRAGVSGSISVFA